LGRLNLTGTQGGQLRERVENGTRLGGLCCLVDSLGFVPYAGKLPSPGTQALQPGSFRAGVAASFAAPPVTGGPVESHFRIKDYNSFLCHAATMPECALPRNPWPLVQLL
jgi:hypothetical protein